MHLQVSTLKVRSIFREHNSALTVACVSWYSLKHPASFDLRAAAALGSCCCHLYRQFATHNYLAFSVLGLLHLPVQFFLFLEVAVNNCCFNKLEVPRPVFVCPWLKNLTDVTCLT